LSRFTSRLHNSEHPSELFERLDLRSPFLQLGVLGAFTWLVYLHLTLTYPLPGVVARFPLTDFGRANHYSQAALKDFLISMFIPLGLYLMAWHVLRRVSFDRRLLALVIGLASLFTLTLLIMYPIGATDLFDYVFYSRILVRYGQNPLSVPPMAFRSDPFIRTVIWYKTPAPYGPLWVLLTVPGSYLAGDDLTLNLLAMKVPPALFFLGCVFAISAILKHLDPGHRLVGTLLFAWNPLVLFEAPGNGHNGIIMMFFVLLAVYFLVRRAWIWIMPALAASVLIQYASALLILPFLLYCWRAQAGSKNRFRDLVISGTLSFVLVAVAIAPFFAIPTGLLEEAHWFSLLAIPSLLYHYLKGFLDASNASFWTMLGTHLTFLVVYGLGLRRMTEIEHPRGLLHLSTWLILAYLAIASVSFQPWFILWPIALGIWINHRLVRRVLLVSTASGLLSYAVAFFWVWNWTSWQKIQTNAIFVGVIFGPPLVAGLLTVARDQWVHYRRTSIDSLAVRP
jgi:hypothetical protein